MGPIPPKKLTRALPSEIVKKINEINDYLVARHISDVQFDSNQAGIVNTPSGVLLKFRPKGNEVTFRKLGKPKVINVKFNRAWMKVPPS